MAKEEQQEKWKSIKEWEWEDRPREKMMQKGAKALTNAELLAILIQKGTKNKSALDLAKTLLTHSHQDLNELARLGLKTMMTIKGIGQAKALTLMAALELGRRKQLYSAIEKKHILNSKDAAGLLAPLIADLPHEAFCVIYLNTANKVLHYEQISTGGLAATVVDIRMIMKNALQWLATGLIIAHNHPSGNLKPSRQDRQITQKLAEAGRLLDIKLNDHIIVSNNHYLSFADEGIL
ncbi:MAG TPA: DNA repair protein RadC [Edaphocola sp.]|nr:DNA repair protein RadC [Edaphocola sp.]